MGNLGDTVIALPAFWSIRRAFPAAKITLLSNGHSGNDTHLTAGSVLPGEGLFDDIVSYPVSGNRVRQLFGLASLLLKLRRRRFDSVIYLVTRNRFAKQIARDERFFRLAGIEKILCKDHLERNVLVPEPPKPTPTVVSEAQFLLDCLASESLAVDAKPEADLRLTAREKEAAHRWAEANIGGDPRSKRLVAVAPGSKWPSKVWAEERFYETVQRLIDAHEIFPVIFGGPEDREKGDRLIQMWGRGANAAGELNVRESAAMLEGCELYVGNDTGTMHLGAAVGTKCVGIFAAIDWIGRWYPLGDGHVVIRKRVECEGCHRPVSFNDNKCLDLISVDEVYAACESILTKRVQRSVTAETNTSISNR